MLQILFAIKKIIAILSMSDFKSNLFYTKVSSSLCSLNQGLYLLYRKKNLSQFNNEVLHREQLNFFCI